MVDDLDASIDRLRDRGVELADRVMVRPEIRAAWFRDSEGNLLRVAQFPGG